MSKNGQLSNMEYAESSMKVVSQKYENYMHDIMQKFESLDISSLKVFDIKRDQEFTNMMLKSLIDKMHPKIATIEQSTQTDS